MHQTRQANSIPEHIPSELVLDFDATNDHRLSENIFQRLGEIRDMAPPIAFSPYNGGHWMVFDRDHIKTVLSSPEVFTSTHISAGSVAMGGPPMIPLGLDPPEHGPWRVMLMKYFGPAKVRELETVMRQRAEQLISKLENRETCEFIHAVAEPFPISIFMELLGIPVERFPEFRDLAVTVLSASDPGVPPPQEVILANQKIMAILSELISTRSKTPGDDLISSLIQDRINGESITVTELLSLCFVLFLGGLDTVTNALGFGMRLLAEEPELQKKLRTDPLKIPETVEKLLARTAFVNTNRMVKTDTVLGGVTMKAGDVLWNISWAGNNDNAGNSVSAGHLAFGGGPHMCAGMHLARLELRIFYETWFSKMGPFTLDKDPEPSMAGGSIMEIKRLLLKLTPTANHESY